MVDLFAQITDPSISDFQEKGYLILKGMYPEPVIKEVKARIQRMVDTHPEACLYDKSVISGNLLLHRIYSPIYVDNHIGDLLQIVRLQEIIEKICSEKVLLLTDKVNLKLPGGKGFPPHQDMQGSFKNYVGNIVTAFICLDDSNEKNGCLEIAEGLHKRGLFEVEDRSIVEKDLRTMKFKKIIESAGDVAIFDGFLPHRSNANLSNRSRTCVVLTFNKAEDGSLRDLYFRDGAKMKNM